jgi:hypothetical protein
MQAYNTDSLNIVDLQPVILSHVASYRCNFRHFAGTGTIQLGWAVHLAQCSTTTFDAVKKAHLNHLLETKNLAPYRHPLYTSIRPRWYPPYRLDQAIHLITRIPSSNHSCWTSPATVRRRGPPPYQHFSTRRSLIIQDHLYEQDLA